MFRTIPMSIIKSYPLYTQQWYMSYRFADSLRAGSGWNFSSILILLKSCQQTCMTHTIAVCTVDNSWWWTEELSETCRVLSQNKNFEKLVHLFGYIIRNLSRCTVTWTSNAVDSILIYLGGNSRTERWTPYLGVFVTVRREKWRLLQSKNRCTCR
jgi:hypothetical protein